MNSSDPRAGAHAQDTRHRRYVVPSVAALARVRDSIRNWLGDTVDEETVQDILLIVSEVGANAIEATPSQRPPPVLDAHIGKDEVLVATTNYVEPPGDDEVKWDLDDPLRPGGRGLLLVAACADDVRIEPDGDTVTVRCTLELGYGRGTSRHTNG